MTAASLTLGPALFHWPAEEKRDFYFKIADEAPVDKVYIGEVVCSKRAPFFGKYYDEVATRLQSAGKQAVFSTLAEIMLPLERKMTADMCAREDFPVEANDASALYHLRGRPHHVGPFVNVYNEGTLDFLAQKGATHVTLPPEIAAAPLAALGAKAAARDVTLETQVYGRLPLALSARCYHARAHGRVKDNCRHVCQEDPDGMDLATLGDENFLAVNGIQTLSYNCLNLMAEMDDLHKAGINAFRLSPHHHDMIATARLFRDVLDGALGPAEGTAKLKETGLPVPHTNGFYHGVEGHRWVSA